MGERSFIVTQSIKKMKAEEREWALDPKGFRRLSDNKPFDLSKLTDDDNNVYYKEEPYTPKKIHQRLIVTYSPRYARYQKTIREKQVDRANAMLASGSAKKQRKNPNDPARFIGKLAATKASASEQSDKTNASSIMATMDNAGFCDSAKKYCLGTKVCIAAEIKTPKIKKRPTS